VKRIAILGSTGSIGTQALEVIGKNPDKFEVVLLTANHNKQLLLEQALKFKPKAVVIANEDLYQDLKKELEGHPTAVHGGEKAITELVSMPEIDLVLTAMVGFSGLAPTLAAIKAKKQIALSNKETLVVAGDLVTATAKEYGVNIYPVDSEHSAIFQCLVGEDLKQIEKIYLTASGGPFRGKTKEQLSLVTKKEALKHPNWVMGAKVTIDSATLMNKALEAIEAKWLFDLSASQIEVIVHPQSIVHSLVQFCDGSMKAQMGLPDMRLPIQYALYYPERLFSDFERFDFLKYPNLSFEKPDLKVFRNLNIGLNAMAQGGNMPCAMNAANEIVVEAFLNDQIGFLEMSDVIETILGQTSFIASPNYLDYQQTDSETRLKTQELIKKTVLT